MGGLITIGLILVIIAFTVHWILGIIALYVIGRFLYEIVTGY